MNRELKVGTMVGSLRRGAYSCALAGCLPTLSPSGMTISPLPSIGMFPHFDQDILDEDGVPAPVAEFSDCIAALDGLLIVSPEYNWSIPGVLKNALDWLSRLNPMPLKDMPVLILTTSPGLLGGARAHPPIRNVLHALDCRILARPEIQIAQCAAKIDGTIPCITDSGTAEFVASRILDFQSFILEQRRSDSKLLTEPGA